MQVIRTLEVNLSKKDLLVMLIKDKKAQDVFMNILTKYKQRKSEEIIDSFFLPAASIESRKFTRNFLHEDNLDHARHKRKSYQWIKTPKYSSFHTHPQQHFGTRSPTNKERKHQYGSSTSYYFTSTSPITATTTTRYYSKPTSTQRISSTIPYRITTQTTTTTTTTSTRIPITTTTTTTSTTYTTTTTTTTSTTSTTYTTTTKTSSTTIKFSTTTKYASISPSTTSIEIPSTPEDSFVFPDNSEPTELNSLFPTEASLTPSATTIKSEMSSSSISSNFVFPSRIPVPKNETDDFIFPSVSPDNSEPTELNFLFPTEASFTPSASATTIISEMSLSSISSDFVFPSRIPVPETEDIDGDIYDELYDLIIPRENFDKNVVVEEEDKTIKNTADLVFAVDTFSNLVGNNDDENITNLIEDNDADYKDKGEKKDDISCYTHTVMLLGHCIVMCDDTIVRFCERSS